MIYLSLLILNPRSRQVQAELRDPYQMHRTISRAFGEDPATYAAARCLFRVDEISGDAQPRLLVQSQMTPDWSPITAIERYLAEEPRLTSYAPRFTAGQLLAFRLRCNPTVKRQGSRYALRTEAERMTWLARKAETGGFVVCRADIKALDPLTTCTAKAQTVTLNSVQYDGLLRVMDPERFAATLASGIGSAKGFGFGLLSLARP